MTGPTAPQTAVDAAGWDELERLAREATPGPWHEKFRPPTWGVAVTDDGQYVYADPGTANAAYIAAADPTTVLGLIAELRQAIAHDRQPYPTAWAYEQVCRVRDEQSAELVRLRAIRPESSAETAIDVERLARALDSHYHDADVQHGFMECGIAIAAEYQALAPADAAGDASSDHPGERHSTLHGKGGLWAAVADEYPESSLTAKLDADAAGGREEE